MHILVHRLNVSPKSYVSCIFGPAFCLGQWLYCKWITRRNFATFNLLPTIWVSILFDFITAPALLDPSQNISNQDNMLANELICVWLIKQRRTAVKREKAKQKHATCVSCLHFIISCIYYLYLVYFVIT